VAKWYIRWSCEGDSEDDVYRPVAEPAVGSLSLGDYGPRVAELDRALSAGGFLVEAPNDAFDFGTLKAVLDLQFQLGIDVDGYAGPMTLGALGLA
jgi:peptidoglycan hydrolase-like protein with peptidoglycan-binding domain